MSALNTIHIDGTWRAAGSGATREVIDPADATVLAVVAEGGAEDADAAIAAARRAFDDGPWPHKPVAERAGLLRRVAELLQRDREEIAITESRDTGKTLEEGRVDVDDVTAAFRYFADLVMNESGGRVVDAGDPDVHSIVVHEPVGVCALIAPWNYPLLQASWKIAPALAAGNTFVLKPSEVTPLSTVHLIRLLSEAGLPDGAANLVTGAGDPVGARFSEHPDVDLVSFTGGLASGTKVARAAAPTVKKVALELGGKNPNVVFADACATDEGFDTAVDQALNAAFFHSGQVCSAGARLIIQDSVSERFVTELARRADAIRLGRGTFDGVECGPLVSAQQLAKVEMYVASAREEGAIVRSAANARSPTTYGPRAATSTGRPSSTAATARCGWSARRRSARFSPSRPSAPRKRPSRWPTTPTTDSPAPSGRPTRVGPAGSPDGCATAPSGSTTTTPTCRRPSGAASGSPARGASSARPGSPSTASPSTSTRT